MAIRETHIGAGEFKAKCLRLLDDVAHRRTPLIITKRGKPVAKLVPVDEAAAPSPDVSRRNRPSEDDDIVGFFEDGAGAA